MSTPLDPHQLGRSIAGLRRAQGLSQRRLAEVAGVSHGYIALLELGRLPSPGKARLDAVARALELHTADALLGGAESSAASSSEAFTSHPRTPAPAAPEHAVRSLRIVSTASPDDAIVDAPSNVVGNVDLLRSPSARPLPVFRWGSCGDPRDRESPPDPDHLEFPPPGRESLIGPGGFGVMVKGDSMAARGILDGDVVWVNPERAYAFGKVVLAMVTSLAGDSGMVVKTYARADVGECLMSETLDEGRTAVVCKEFKVIGPVVGITSWRLPS
jgi:SOS-response transcriptional repressor LexA